MVDINCSFHWVQEFSTSLSKTILSHSAASIHSMVPALGIPSDLVRIIDVVTIGPGVSTLPIIFVHTSHEGKLVFSIVACPTLGGQPAAGGSNRGSQLASGSMRSHSAPQLVDLVHKCEARMYVHRDDRVLRLAMTMADGAIQGPGSTQFEEQEAEVDRRNVRHVGVCQFHRLDNAGSMTDRQFPAAALFDRFLRLIRQGFAFGTGTTIMRAVADKFDVLANELDAKATELRVAAGRCQHEGRCKQAERLNREAAREAAHAASLRRCGWTTYRRPLAPKVDGTRKVVWQSRARRRVFDIFAIIYWSLQVRMVGVREQARVDAERKRPASGGKSDRIGERTAQMRFWRAIGRSLFDMRMMVFNMGRSDFRAKHTATNALIVQTTLHSSIETTRYCMDMYSHMFQSLAALLDVRAIIRMLELLLDVPTAYARPYWRKRVVWATAKTLLQHRAWRQFPLLVSHLPHILLGGTLQGVDLHSGVFEELGPQKKVAASGANETSRDRYLKRRKQRFADVAYAIDSLIDWVKLERRNYKERAVSTPARRQPLKTPGHQGKRVAEDIREAECTIHGDEHIRLGNKAASGAEDLNLDEEREASDADSSSSSSSGSSRQRTAKKEELQEALSVEKKLGNLSKVKPSASTAPGESRHAVVYDIYRNTIGDTPFDRSATGEADGEGSDDSDSSIDEHSHPTNQPTHPPDTDKSRLLTREIEPVTSSGSLSSDWVITSCKERGTIQITPWSTWRGRCDLALINTFPAREKALYHYGRVFGGEALASGSIPDRDTLMLSMAEMFKEFDGELWAADVEQVARCMRHIPDEILERISLHEFVEQYDRLRSWVHRLRTSPFGREFLNLVRCKVAVETPATTAGGPVSSASTTDRAAGHGQRTTSTTDGAAGHWQRATSTTDGAAGHWQHTTSTTDRAAGHW